MGKNFQREMAEQFISRCSHLAIIALTLHSVNRMFPDSVYSYFSAIANFILYALLARFTHNCFQCLCGGETVSADQKAILITGCNTGFGNLLAKKLDSKGFHVFASCLYPEGEEVRKLKQSCSDHLRVLCLDVTKDEDVEKALQFVENNLGSNVLWAVINNAGISKGFSTDFSTIDDFKDTIDVNALGPVRVTKAFLPLLKKSKGRVVNVTSLAAKFALLEMCAYTMSKRALLGFTEMLRLEMNIWGVRVISVEPELLKTPITDPELIIKRLEVETKKIPTPILSSYGEEYVEELKKVIVKTASLRYPDIDNVVDTIITAVTQKYPKHVYKPRRHVFSQICCFILENMPFEMYEQLVVLIMKILSYPVPKDIINCEKQNS